MHAIVTCVMPAIKQHVMGKCSRCGGGLALPWAAALRGPGPDSFLTRPERLSFWQVTAMKEQMQQRLQRQEEEERQTKAQLAEKAAGHLESFYQVSSSRLSVAGRNCHGVRWTCKRPIGSRCCRMGAFWVQLRSRMLCAVH